MPLLAREPVVFPDDLLAPSPDRWPSWQRSSVRDQPDARWWVLHTRPRAEKALARHLHRRALAYFLPQYERQWRSRGRLLRSHLPLFPGYLFLFGDSQARGIALETNLVPHCLAVEDQAQLDQDLARVHALIVSGAPLAPEALLQPGAAVRIIRGPLAGMDGKVLRRGKNLSLQVEVRFLQRGVSVEIESWMIEPLPEPLAMTAS